MIRGSLLWGALMIASLGAFGVALTGCLTPEQRSAAAAKGRATLKACELGQLGPDGQIGFATAQQIASNPGSTSAALEQAGLSMLPGQLECGASALLAWLSGLASPAPTDSSVARALVAADADVRRQHAIDVLREYLVKHPPPVNQ